MTASAITGTGSLTQAGNGTLILNAANSYTGGTTVAAGTLQLGNAAANGTIGSGTYSLAAGTALYLNYLTAITAGAWTNNLSGSGTLELRSAQGANGRRRLGPGFRLRYTSFGSGFTGTLRVDNGRFDSSPAGLGGVSNIIINNGAQFMGWSGTYSIPVTIAGNGWGEAGFPEALRIAANSAGTWAGSIALTANSGILAQTGSTFNITGSISGNFQNELNAQGGATLNVAPAAAVQNSYGSTEISGAGGVGAGKHVAFSTGGLLMNGGTLQLNGNSFTFANLSGTAGTIQNNHATINSTITVGSDGSSTAYARHARRWRRCNARTNQNRRRNVDPERGQHLHRRDRGQHGHAGNRLARVAREFADEHCQRSGFNG